MHHIFIINTVVSTSFDIICIDYLEPGSLSPYRSAYSLGVKSEAKSRHRLMVPKFNVDHD